jgi:hypothetical protein
MNIMLAIFGIIISNALICCAVALWNIQSDVLKIRSAIDNARRK